VSRRDLAIVAAFKACVSTLVLATGFRAVSDDDFARVVIAQRFAESPAFDPSGTSWLPLPFWLQGAVMMLLGRSLGVAQATAFLLGILAALAVLIAARWAGVPRGGALIGALIASAVPYAAWLGVATVPDGVTAALVVLGAAAAASTSARHRVFGALALCAAALSRYEAWPVAAAFSALSVLDAIRLGRARLALPGALALLGPVLWLLNGKLVHGDALFFVERVSAYKRAVGGAASSLEALLGQPLSIVRCEPELAGATLVAIAASVFAGRARLLAHHARPLALLGLLVLFLVAGELRASGATHHAERSVLAVWLWLAVIAGHLAALSWPQLGRRGRIAAGSALAGVIALGALVVRPWYARRDDFIDRSSEIAIGRQAARVAGPEQRLLVDSADFGFYAVIAGFGRPEFAEPVDDRDPRRDGEVLGLEARVRESGARWLVLRRDRDDRPPAADRVRAEEGGFLLVDLAP
jgi:hypothetical protein